MSTETNEIQRLRAAVQELAVLNDIATAISSVYELDQVVELIVLKCVKHLKVEQGAVMLLEDEQSSNPFQTMVRQADSQTEIIPYHLGVQLSGWMLQNQKPLIVNDFQHDERFNVGTHLEFPIRSLLSVPLRLQGRMIGLLNVFNKRDESGFKEEDQRLLSIIAAQSAQVIENARLYEEEQVLMRMEEDLRVAYEIQVNLLPESNPEIPGYDIAGKSIPARKVGGDYYDFIQINEDRWAFCLGDISGKGVPASLLMANLQATLRSQTLFGSSCKESLTRSNKLLYHSTDIQKFATLFYGILDCERHHIEYSKAGHEAPFLFSKNSDVRRLNTGGTILGFMENSAYKEETISFKPGDVLVIYSDGITEAMNEEEEQFGEEGLEPVIREHIDLPAEHLIGKIVEAARAF
ncbi:MAG TPA: GAF domain-containing SpoIIE family protein phosphatase, partial [bacterium]|nr:GAF domain-containing SpoIIE family protein phosphatase [bacterium]